MTTADLENWTPRERPERITLEGARTRLAPLSAKAHTDALYALVSLPGEQAIWDYMPYGPYPTYAAFAEQMRRWQEQDDPLAYAIVNTATEKPEGALSLMRINPAHGVIEIGGIWFTKPLRKTAAATEALYLLMDYALSGLGYRRLEWKCNALNHGSMRAARRLGFTYEGTFRQAMVVKGKNRDSAWFSILDGEWPRLKAGYQKWLEPDNFDEQGRQKAPLQDFLV